MEKQIKEVISFLLVDTAVIIDIYYNKEFHKSGIIDGLNIRPATDYELELRGVTLTSSNPPKPHKKQNLGDNIINFKGKHPYSPEPREALANTIINVAKALNNLVHTTDDIALAKKITKATTELKSIWDYLDIPVH